MPLKLELKAGERLRLGDCTLVNKGGRAQLAIEGDMPVLRERDMLSAGFEDSPARQLCLALQRLYLARMSAPGDPVFRRLIDDLRDDPALRERAASIARLAKAGQLYPALRAARELIEQENRRASA